MSKNLIGFQHKSSYDAFKNFDTNKDGVTHQKELIDKVSQADKNKDGQLSSNEASSIGLIHSNDIQKVNKHLKKHHISPQTVVFKATKPTDIKYGLDKANNLLGKITTQVPVSSDRFGTLSDSVVSILAHPGVIANRVITGTFGRMGNLDAEKLERVAKATLMTRHGNCGELAATIAVEAKKDGAQRVELFSIENHLFVAINREQKSDSADPQTWGEHAIIIDPWMNGGKGETYEAHKYRFREAPKNQGLYIPTETQRFKSTTPYG